LFAIWKRIHHISVYQDPFSPPFAQSFFNYLFYWSYGAIVRGITSFLRLSDFELPTIARLTTLAFTGLGIVVTVQLVKLVSPVRGWAVACLGIIICANPLVGYWAITTRPDIGALAFELAGIWLVLRSSRNRRGSLLLAVFLFYIAWAFKQTFVAGWLASVFYCLLQGRRREGGLLVFIFLGALGASLVIGGQTYRYAVVLSQVHMRVVPLHSIHLFIEAILKAPLFGVGLVVVTLEMVRTRTVTFLFLALIISLSFAATAAMKVGASDNYFFEPAALSGLACIRATSTKNSQAAVRKLALMVALGAQLISVSLVLGGIFGKLKPDTLPELMIMKRSLDKYAGTSIATLNAANLPWFHTRGPHLVLADSYYLDRAAGMPFRYGGVAGMLKSGRIDVVACKKPLLGPFFDGFDLRTLTKVEESEEWLFLSTKGLALH
jgi:hypothetical protein